MTIRHEYTNNVIIETPSLFQKKSVYFDHVNEMEECHFCWTKRDRYGCHWYLDCGCSIKDHNVPKLRKNTICLHPIVFGYFLENEKLYRKNMKNFVNHIKKISFLFFNTFFTLNKNDYY